MNRKAIIYYSLASFFGLIISLTVVNVLAWPVMAELPIAISLFIQYFAGAKYVFINIIERKDITFLKVVTYFMRVTSQEIELKSE